MGKHYDLKLKEEIVNKYTNNEGTLNSLQGEYGNSYKTIFNWLRKYKKQGNLTNDINHTRCRKKRKY